MKRDNNLHSHRQTSKPLNNLILKNSKTIMYSKN